MYKILLVEDDMALHFVYKRMKVWNEEGFEINMTATNGRDALKILDEHKFDMVITDIRMPILDGIGLLKKMSEKQIKIYTIILSSYDEFEYARQAMIYGAADFVVKPVKENDIKEALKRAKIQLEEDKEKNDLTKRITQKILNAGGEIDDENFFNKILEYIMSYVTEDKSMEDAAEYMELSKDYFGKMCKNKLKVTFKQLQTITKMEYAGFLLKSSNIKVYELSELLGYSSPDYFTKIFTEIMGTTPKKYGELLFFNLFFGFFMGDLYARISLYLKNST